MTCLFILCSFLYIACICSIIALTMFGDRMGISPVKTQRFFRENPALTWSSIGIVVKLKQKLKVVAAAATVVILLH